MENHRPQPWLGAAGALEEVFQRSKNTMLGQSSPQDQIVLSYYSALNPSLWSIPLHFGSLEMASALMFGMIGL